MKRFLTILAVAMLAVAPAAMAQTTFGWTVSNSTTTALSNTGPIGPGPSMFAGNLYLWLYCGTTGGMAAAEMDVVELAGGGAPTGFTPMNGFLNAGSPTALLLAVGGCPSGPVLAGSFSVGPDAFLPDIEICLVPSAANARNITVECGTGLGIANDVQGFHKLGPASCSAAQLCPTSVEENTWGSIKGLYR